MNNPNKNKPQSSKETLDLEIDNYELEDILELFKIYSTDFTEADLKKAKQIVLKTHPDKSQLPADYFRFFSKAYKRLYSIWEFRCKSEKNPNNENTEYSEVSLNHSEEEKREMLDSFFDSNEKLKKSKNFNKWFNKEFEKNKITTEAEEKGYGDWLKSNENKFHDFTTSSEANMGENFAKLKREVRAVTVFQEVQDISSYGTRGGQGFTDLSLSAPQQYSSDLFSSLQYQDLQQAHTETVIPVTEEDYENVPKFGSMNDYMTYRDSEALKFVPLSEKQALDYLKNREKTEDQDAVRRAYDLAKQTQEAQKKQKNFWSNIQLLHNK
jgi:hypothetical protein